MSRLWKTVLAVMAVLALLVWPQLTMGQTGSLWTLHTAESAEGGPPSSSLLDVLPLENGVWVTTDAGIGYYNGHTWLPWTMVQEDSPLREYAHTVVLGDGGRVWIGTSSFGIISPNLDGTWEPYTHNDVLPGKSVTAILTAQDGTTWIGTHRGLARVGPGGTVASVDPPGPANSHIMALAEDPEGRMWIGTQADGLHRFDGEGWRCYTGENSKTGRTVRCDRELPGDGTQINALADDGRGGLWVGTRTGLAHFDGHRFVPLPDALAKKTGDQSILALWRSASNHLWVGLERGALVFDGHTSSLPFGSRALSLGEVRAIRGDLDGNVWLATNDGLLHYRRAWEPLSLDGESIPGGAGAMAQDEAGSLWFAMDDFVARLSDGTWRRMDPLAQLPLPSSSSVVNVVQAILPHPSGEMWFGSPTGVVRWTTDERWERIDLPSLENLPSDEMGVHAMMLGAEDDVWMGTTHGLFRRAPDGTWTPETVDDLPVQPVIYTLLRDEDGGIWAGTSYGVMRVTTNGDVSLYTVSQGLADQTVYSLYEDSRSQLWFGTLQGVSRWEGGGEKPFESQVGLEGQEVLGIAEDRLGRLWFGTRRGAFVYDGRSPIRYTISDGLASNEIRGLFRDDGGRLWLATATGIQRYEPDGARPRVDIVGLRVGNDLIRPQDGRIVLDWNQAEFRIELDGGDLSTPFGELTYACQMQGEDPAPHSGSETLIPYELAPGSSHTFTATALDKDLNQSQSASLQIEIGRVPITEKVWFRRLSLFLGLVGLPVAGLYIFGYPLYKRRGEKRYHQDILLSLRQDTPAAASYVAKTVIRHPGLLGWGWRLSALRRGEFARVRDPTEDLPIDHVSRPRGLDDQLRMLEERRGRYRGIDKTADETRLHPLGRALFQAAFPPVLASRLQEARKEKKRIRIRLRFDGAHAGELARLPWEFAYHDEAGFLAQHVDTALVRFLDATEAPRGRLRDRLRILVVIANASDLRVPAVRPARELQALQELAARDEVEISYLVGPAAAKLLLGVDLPPGSVAAKEGLEKALDGRLNEGFDVVHFIGHAGPHHGRTEENVARGEMVLYAENAQGDYAPLGARDLLKILDGLRGQGLLPRLFFLNACQTGDVAGSESLTGLIPALIRDGGVPAVVGMQYPIANRVAGLFAGDFYKALIKHGQADWAMSVAHHAVAQEVGDAEKDWGVAVLYLQARDGFVFKTY